MISRKPAAKSPSLRRRLRKFRRMANESEHLDRWMVSYADFITLLFAFFVVMYAISRVNEGQYRVVSEALLEAFQKNNPVKTSPKAALETIQTTNHQDLIAQKYALTGQELEKTPVPLPTPEQQKILAEREQRIAQLREVAAELHTAVQSLLEQGQVHLSQDDSGITVDISASALFKSGQANLEPSSLPNLRAVGQVLAKIPNRIQVEGHTDTVPIATVAYPSNWELSSARAATVVRLFIEQGVPGERLTATGFGEFRPLDSNETVDGRARNRRVTVIIQADQPNQPSR